MKVVLRDRDGHPTGKVQRRGEVWTVLPGSSDDVGVVFLLQEGGQWHTWDDDMSIFEFFDRLGQ
jgi:hypothetical protein